MAEKMGPSGFTVDLGDSAFGLKPGAADGDHSPWKKEMAGRRRFSTVVRSSLGMRTSVGVVESSPLGVCIFCGRTGIFEDISWRAALSRIEGADAAWRLLRCVTQTGAGGFLDEPLHFLAHRSGRVSGRNPR